MSNAILTSITGLSTPASGDFFYIVDISSTSENAAGDSRKITYSNLVGGVLSELGVTSSVVELNFVDGVTSAIQTQIDAKQSIVAGVSSTEIGYLDGVTSSIQTQINAKATSASPTFTGTITITGSTIVNTGTITLPTSTDTLVGRATTDTLTNKRITPRIVTATDDATAVIDVDVTDQYQLTAIANATEFTVTGTPVNGQKLIVRLKDAGVAKALTWTGFIAIGCTAPTTTVAGKTHYIGCIYNSATPTWNIVAAIVEA
jgi:hypothetical protein